MRRALYGVVALWAVGAGAQEFRYDPPGQLVPGSGQGRADDRVWVPGMRFPIEHAPAFANSQVWGHGGNNGPGGDQCDDANYSYPWHDDYCETRDWDMPLCPSGTGHQGQDIRPSTCEDQRWWAVAAEDGTITAIGSYSVSLMSDGGTRHRYLHMNPDTIIVHEGQRVARGDRLGRISNWFPGSSTTFHLHFDQLQNVNGLGDVYIPPYMSLVRAYEDLIGQPAAVCAVVPADGAVVDDGGPCFEKYGPAASWRRADGVGEGTGLWWTYAWVHDTPGNWARWQLAFAEAGRYRVAVRVERDYAGSTRTPYKVRADGQETDLRVDLTSDAPWVTLGEFDFAAGGDQWVSVYDNSGEDRDLELRIPVDAVRVERVWPAAPDAAVPPPDAAPRDAEVAAADARVARDAEAPATDAGDAEPVAPDAAAADAEAVPPTDDAEVSLEAGPVSRKRHHDDGCAQSGGTAAPGLALAFLALGLARRRRA
jgi:hypothetical protein